MAVINDAIVLEIAADVSEVRKQMERMENSVNKATKKSSSGVRDLTKSIGGLVAGAGGLLLFERVGRAFFDTNRETQRLFASLKTVTGSADAASDSFQRIERFAAETPESVESITTAFIRLKALGLDPSEEALRSYGNTASAMGKDLMQFVEAVADATTGEFERLKEFGIKAKSEGENVSFTFQGVTTTVRKNAKEINGFLQSIGENNFAGAMAERMNTLDGIMSNLQDNVSSIFRAIGGTGGVNSKLGEMLAQVRDLTGAVAENKGAVSGWTHFLLSGGEFIAKAFFNIGNAVQNVLLMFTNALPAVGTFFAALKEGKGITESIDLATQSFMNNARIDANDAKDAIVNLVEDYNNLVHEGTKGADMMGLFGTRTKAATTSAKELASSASEVVREFVHVQKVLPRTAVEVAGINLEMVPLKENTIDWGKALRDADEPSKALKVAMEGIARSSGAMAAAFARGDMSMKSIAKSLLKQGVLTALNHFLPGSSAIGGFAKGFIGSIFRHGGTVKQARHGMSIPSDPRGQTGVPIIAHPGERVLNRRETESLKPLLNILDGRMSERAINMPITFNTSPGASVDENAIVAAFRRMIVPEVSAAFRSGRLG